MCQSNSSLRIGYVLKRFPVLSETFILNEILAIEARGVHVHIFSLEKPEDPRFHEDLPQLKARVSYVPNLAKLKSLLGHNWRIARVSKQRYWKTFGKVWMLLKPVLLWRLLQAGYVANEVKRLKLNHIHAHFATRPTTVANLASSISGIPYSFTAYAMDIFKKELSKKALSQKIQDAKTVVAISEYNKQYLSQISNGSAHKIVHIYNGIHLDKYTPANNNSSGLFTILCVARLVEKKGLPILVKACHRLKESSIKFQCWIVGKGRIRPQLEALIKELDLKDYVKLLGPHTQGEVLERYRKADLFVLPCVVAPNGNQDGLPVSIIEALACGLPVVTTPIAGISEVIKEFQNGILVPPGDVQGLADAIETMIREKELYEKLKANARTSVVDQFDLEKTIQRLIRNL